MKKFITTALAVFSLAGFAALPALADPPGEVYNEHSASVNNTNANPNACWGQDRSFYASEGFFASGNMDIKQSFNPALGKISDQKAAWIETYCAE
jgi:hypothetical protein